jgi:hypothetical protein
MRRFSKALFSSAIALCTACAGSGGGSGAGGAGDAGAGGIGGAGGEYLEGALEIRGVALPDSECAYSTTLDPAPIEGSWDLSSRERYFAVLVVENTLESRIEDERQGELNGLSLDSIEVTLLGSDGTPLEIEGYVNPYRATASGAIPVTDGVQPSLELVGITAIPASLADSLSSSPPDATAQFRAFGRRADGTPARSSPFLWPIRFCDECLAEECAAPGPPAGSCTPGQDGDPWCRP